LRIKDEAVQQTALSCHAAIGVRQRHQWLSMWPKENRGEHCYHFATISSH
jgi:hypothetical protein